MSGDEPIPRRADAAGGRNCVHGQTVDRECRVRRSDQSRRGRRSFKTVLMTDQAQLRVIIRIHRVGSFNVNIVAGTHT